MPIDFTHKDDLAKYVEDNIIEINRGIAKFKSTNGNEAIYDDTDIKNYLKEKIISEFPLQKNMLLSTFRDMDYVKARITDLAIEYVYYKKHLEKMLMDEMLKELKNTYSEEMVEGMIEAVFDNADVSDGEKKYLNNDLKKIIKKTLHLILQNGFAMNINNLEGGIMTANAGDSAQLLFVSRAILAGYNCSNVDVRSSRYDAVIDYLGKIFRIQVKGISGDIISFKDRDRGGRGIDTHNERNIGQRIKSEDCDIYVAVDKQVGLCYIIPMMDIDPWADEEIVSVSVNKLKDYLESWEKIQETYERMYGE